MRAFRGASQLTLFGGLLTTNLLQVGLALLLWELCDGAIRVLDVPLARDGAAEVVDALALNKRPLRASQPRRIICHGSVKGG
jgi:hypothetical protein